MASRLLLTALLAFGGRASAGASPINSDDPIPACEHLLTDAKAYLADLEVGEFERLRLEQSENPKSLRALLFRAYEVGIEGTGIPLIHAQSLVPAYSNSTVKYIKRAEIEGLLIFEQSTHDHRTKTVRAGPLLPALVREKATTYLARVYEHLHNFPGRGAIDGYPAVPSTALERLLARAMLTEYTGAWQPDLARTKLHLRHTYGLLARLYKQALFDRNASVRSTTRFVLSNIRESKQKFVEAAIQQGLLVEVPGGAGPNGYHRKGIYLSITDDGIRYVEGRINARIARMNLVLNQLAADQP